MVLLKRFTHVAVVAALSELNGIFTINEYQTRLFSLDNVLFYYQMALARGMNLGNLFTGMSGLGQIFKRKLCTNLCIRTSEYVMSTQQAKQNIIRQFSKHSAEFGRHLLQSTP